MQHVKFLLFATYLLMPLLPTLCDSLSNLLKLLRWSFMLYMGSSGGDVIMVYGLVAGIDLGITEITDIGLGVVIGYISVVVVGYMAVMEVGALLRYFNGKSSGILTQISSIS